MPLKTAYRDFILPSAIDSDSIAQLQSCGWTFLHFCIRRGIIWSLDLWKVKEPLMPFLF